MDLIPETVIKSSSRRVSRVEIIEKENHGAIGCDKDDPVKRFEITIAAFLFQAVADGTLRKRLTEGMRHAREGMCEEDRERLDAHVEQTIARCGVEAGRQSN